MSGRRAANGGLPRRGGELRHRHSNQHNKSLEPPKRYHFFLTKLPPPAYKRSASHPNGKFILNGPGLRSHRNVETDTFCGSKFVLETR